MSEKPRFRGPFHSQYRKRAQTLLQSGRRHLYHIYWSLWMWLSWEKSFSLLYKISTLFVNTLTADDKYFLLHTDNLTQPIQIPLPQKQKTFSQFFSHFRNLHYILSVFKNALVLCKILGLFVNTLTAYDKYSLLNKDNSSQPIQILLSKKQKTFSKFLSAFMKSTSNFKHF